MAVFRRAFNTYQRILNTHPVLTHSVQTGLLMGTGDVIAQTVVEKKELKSIDKIRVIKFASIGFCFVGPFLQVWYTQLARFATGSPYVVTAKKVFADQVIAAPIMAFSVLSLVSLVDGHNIEETKMKLKKTYWDVLLANYKITHPTMDIFKRYNKNFSWLNSVKYFHCDSLIFYNYKCVDFEDTDY